MKTSTVITYGLAVIGAMALVAIAYVVIPVVIVVGIAYMACSRT